MNLYFSALGAFGAAWVLGKPIIALLRRLDAKQTIYEFAPESHRSKAGTPTMGGWIVIAAVALAVIGLQLLGFWPTTGTAGAGAYVLGTAFAFALLGFVDDYLVRRLTAQRGLRWKLKLLLQFAIAGFAAYPLNALIGPMAVAAGAFWIVMWVNAFNLTDGLDGLAAGLSAIAFGALAATSTDPGVQITAVVWAGASLGYLVWNCHPAQVFMGDTGSMALGAAFALLSLSVYLENPKPFRLWSNGFLIGIVFFVEIISVVIQLTSVKALKRKVFLATPIHHHFEALKWAEPKIVVRFWIVGLVAALAAIGMERA